MNNNSAIVLFSGGQDSTTCLFWALEKYDSVQAFSIVYGQRHKREIEAARKIARICSTHHFIIDIGNMFSKITVSALLNSNLENISDHHELSEELPASFVPGRNIILLTLAAIQAYSLRIPNIVTGVCQTDFSGYPDCRRVTIDSLERTLSVGMNTNFTILTPLMFLTKAETINLACSFPGCLEALAWSHTCYEGQTPPCGKCPACKLRAKGFREAGIPDPLIERLKNE